MRAVALKRTIAACVCPSIAEMRKGLLLILTLLTFACSKPEVVVPQEVIPRDSMISLLCDLHLAEASIQLRNAGAGDSARAETYARYRYVFSVHQVDRERVKNSMIFYRSHPEFFHKMYKEVIAKLSERQAKEQKRPAL